MPCCCAGASSGSRPSHYFSWVVHMDGLRERHDAASTEGVFDEAVAAIREAKARGFRVTTNSTFFNTDSPKTVRDVLDFLNDDLKVDAMMISPAYAYEKAPDQEHFLGVEQTRQLFKAAFSDKRRSKWRLNHSPSSWTSWRARSTSSAPPGASRATRSSAGRGLAISWGTVTPPATTSWSRRPTGAPTGGVATHVVRTAWPIAVMSRRRSISSLGSLRQSLRALVNTH